MTCGFGTDSKLEQLTYGLIRFANLQGGASNLIDPDLPGSPLDPSQYRLTTEEGLIYDIDQSFGIRKITEPNGQFLIYSSVGIVHSTGVKTNPLGHITSRTYDPRGNTLTERDSLGAITTMSYDGKNQLLTQVDAAGRNVMRNVYASLGTQLRSTQDALGHLTRFGYDSGQGSGESGELLAIVDALNQSTRFEVNANGWRSAEARRAGPSNDLQPRRHGPRNPRNPHPHQRSRHT